MSRCQKTRMVTLVFVDWGLTCLAASWAPLLSLSLALAHSLYPIVLQPVKVINAVSRLFVVGHAIITYIVGIHTQTLRVQTLLRCAWVLVFHSSKSLISHRRGAREYRKTEMILSLSPRGGLSANDAFFHIMHDKEKKKLRDSLLYYYTRDCVCVFACV